MYPTQLPYIKRQQYITLVLFLKIENFEMFVTDVRENRFTNIYPMVFYDSHEIYCL